MWLNYPRLYLNLYQIRAALGFLGTLVLTIFSLVARLLPQSKHIGCDQKCCHNTSILQGSCQNITSSNISLKLYKKESAPRKSHKNVTGDCLGRICFVLAVFDSCRFIMTRSENCFVCQKNIFCRWSETGELFFFAESSICPTRQKTVLKSKVSKLCQH